MARWPLPDGAPDGELSRVGVSELLDVSTNTITDWLREGMPVLEEGTNGKPYRFQTSHVWAWRCERDANAAAKTHAEKEYIAQLRLAMFPDEEKRLDVVEMSDKDRIEFYKAEEKWMQTNEFRRAFCSREMVRSVFEDALKMVRDQLQGLPDRMERTASLTPDQVQLVIDVVDDTLRSMKAAFENSSLNPAHDEQAESLT